MMQNDNEDMPIKGMLEKGNIDLNNRPRVKNPDGSISTVLSMSANFDGKEYLIPMVSDEGKILTEDQAIDYFKKTKKHLGVFDTPENATNYAQQLHLSQEKQYVTNYKNQTTPEKTDFSTTRNEQINKTVDIIKNKFQGNINISYPVVPDVNANTNISITQPVPTTAFFDKDREFIGLPSALMREPKKQLGFAEAFGREAFEMTLPGDVFDAYQKRQAFAPVENSNLQNVLSQPIPENWLPTDNAEMLRSVPAKYRDSLITDVTSPQQQENIYNYIQEQIAREEQWNTQPYLQKWVAGIAGGFTGMALDAFMFQWLAPFKYAKGSYNFLQRTGIEAGNLLTYSFAREGITTALDPEKKFEDVGYNALRDASIGLLFYGGFKGLASLGKKIIPQKTNKTKFTSGDMASVHNQAFDYNLNGVEARFNVDENADIIDFTASPVSGMAQSAQYIDNAKIFYGSEMAKKGLFWFPQTYKSKLGFTFKSPITMGTSIFNNTVKGLTTEGPVAAITNAIVHHNLETIAGKKYVPNGQSFEAEMNATDGKIKLYQAQFEGYRKHYNGLDITATEEEQLQKLNSRLDKKDVLDPAHFGNRVVNNVLTFGTDTNPVIRDASKLWTDTTREHYTRFLKSQNLDEEIFPQRVYEGHIARSFMRDRMRVDRKGFINSTVQAYIDQDEMINMWMKPLNELVELRKIAQEKIFKNEDVIKNQQEYDALTKQISKYKQKLHKEQLDNPDLKVLLDDYTSLSSDDVKGLKKFLKPYDDTISEIQKLNKQIQELEYTKLQLERNISAPMKKGVNEAKHTKKVANLNVKRNKLIEEIEKLKSTKSNLQNSADEEIARLRKLVLDETELGENVPRKWYSYDEDGKIKFRDPEELPKFRPLFADEEEMLEHAGQYYDSIMGYTDSDLATVALNSYTNPASTKGRRLFVNSKYYLRGGFINTNMPKMIESYIRPLAKNYLLNEKLENFTGVTKKGLDGYIQLIDRYFQQKRTEIENKYKDKKILDKKLKALEKTKASQEEFVTNLINGYVGIRPDKANEAMYTIGKQAKLLAVAVRLTNVALSQLGDSAAIIFKNGPFKFLQAGLAPSITSLNGLIKTKQGIRLKQYANECGLGLEHMSRSSFIKAYEGEFDTEGPSNIVTTGLEAIAHFSQRIALVHFMENFNQKMAASTSQHTFIKLLTKFSEGKKLSNDDRLLLETYGLKPEDWALSVLEQYNQFGEKTIYGYQSDYFKWTNAKTQQRFSNAVFSLSKDAVISGRNTDLPIIKVPFLQKYVNLQNPMYQTMTQFMSYAFAALNKYTIPFMQQLQGKQLLGITLMGALGSAEYIMRKYARGEDVDLEDEDLLREAFANSGATSLLYKSAQFVNAIGNLDIEFLNNDKARNITKMGLLGGPAAGLAEVYGNAFSMVVQNAYNKQDVQKFLRAILPLNNFYLYQPSQKLYDTLTYNLPETRAQANR